jgi:hypothetical protein
MRTEVCQQVRPPVTIEVPHPPNLGMTFEPKALESSDGVFRGLVAEYQPVLLHERIMCPGYCPTISSEREPLVTQSQRHRLSRVEEPGLLPGRFDPTRLESLACEEE